MVISRGPREQHFEIIFCHCLSDLICEWLISSIMCIPFILPFHGIIFSFPTFMFNISITWHGKSSIAKITLIGWLNGKDWYFSSPSTQLGKAPWGTWALFSQTEKSQRIWFVLGRWFAALAALQNHTTNVKGLLLRPHHRDSNLSRKPSHFFFLSFPHGSNLQSRLRTIDMLQTFCFGDKEAEAEGEKWFA